MDQFLNGDEIRSIILNSHKIKKDHKCQRCNGTGYVNWNGEEGGDEKPGKLTEHSKTRDDGECEDCEGIGYVDVLMYNE